ncbi:DUF2188 domain-containing protein [Nitrosospira sp. Nsp18]|uniref:DUF2188 domain-containing protein n=1 Tax=Nitrosospira sp. Nsp18 TaxID=1855334 RepID=UPI00115FB71D
MPTLLTLHLSGTNALHSGVDQCGEGNERITSIHDMQREAIDRARGIAVNQQSELLIQGRDGQIRERNSYGDDLFPPEG